MEPLLRGTLASILMLLALTGCTTANYGTLNLIGDLRVVSLNVHYYAVGRDQTDWSGRRQAVTAALVDLNPDVILFQEMETFSWDGGGEGSSRNDQRDWVLETVPGYTAGANAADASTFPITQPIFYRTARFKLVDQGWFFFSPTPDVIYARTWTKSWPSFTSWVLLEQHSDGRRLYVYNTHPEAYSETNIRLGMQLVAERIDQRDFPEAPVLLGGDFNQFGGDTKLKPLTDLGLVRAPVDTPSFHFMQGWHLYPAIDHFFASTELEWEGGGAVQKQWEGRWPSDHHPVLAVYSWPTTSSPLVSVP